mmetsp:Transcript_27997/g.51639  ORF Transcript_27997/g.51639 Transcript_27997/m.51639 type:complete len:367 (-) Transcript_27997:288-1388(-)
MIGAPKRNNSTNHLFLASLFIFVIYIILVNVYMHHTSATPKCNKEDGRGDLSATHSTQGNGTINPKILVVYAGPNSKSAPRVELYTKNLEFFLRNGIECNTQDTDTVIVVGHEFYHEYFPWIQKINQQCQGRASNNKIILISRRNVCYDMEAARLALYGGVPGLDVPSYDYFLFANCGTTGPAPVAKKDGHLSWTSRFIRLLDDQVKMTGLSMNCEGNIPHIQSMMYVLDKVGLDVVMKSGAIFDCLDPPKRDYINLYERKMGHAILDAGYAIRPLIGGRDIVVSKSNLKECIPCGEGGGVNATKLISCHLRDQYRDIWIKSRLQSIYNGKVPSLKEVVFFKTSRLLTPEIAAQINYTGKINWNWE